MNFPHSLVLFFLSFLFAPSVFSQSSVDFSASKRSGCGALANVQFTDLSTGPVTSWHWDFGNNNTSNLQNPTASYTNTGNYTVSLTVNGPNGSLTETKTAYISVFSSPVAGFQISPITGCEPLTVTFSNNSAPAVAPIKKYIWDFGDGSPENNQENPVYTYPVAGNYTVSLQIIDTNGCTDTEVFGPVEVVSRPQASFSSYNSPNNCSAPHTVNFANYTQGAGLSFFWDFGDGQTSTQKEPVHTYTAMGRYDVKFIVKNALCADTTILPGFVSIEPITSNFTVDKEHCFGDTTSFTSVTTGASRYYWDFGDGTSSTVKDPFKVYADSGYFEVELKVTSGASCSATFKDSIYIKKVIADIFLKEDTLCNFPVSLELINKSNYGHEFTWTKNSNKTNIVQRSHSLDTLKKTFPAPFEEKYYLFAEDTILGCVSVDSQYVFAYDPSPVIYSLDSIFTGCRPLEKQFNFKYSYNNFDSLLSFSWDAQPLDTTGIDSIFKLQFEKTGEYYVILKTENARGCKTMDSVLVLVGDTAPLPNLIFPDTICAGENWFLSVPNLNGTDSISYLISYSTFRDSALAYHKYHKLPVKNYYYPTDTGTVYITHQTIYNGCVHTSAVDSMYVSGPVAQFSSFSNCDASNYKYNFTSQILGKFSSFEWNFGDGSPPNTTDLNPTHTFPAASDYTVNFIVYNEDSTCIDTFRAKLNAAPPPVVSLNGSNIYCTSDSANFFANVVGKYDTLRWYINDSLVAEDTLSYAFRLNSIDSVKLKVVVKNKYGCSSYRESTVKFSKPTADFDVEYQKSCIPFPVTFRSESKGNFYGIDSLFWSFQPWGEDTNSTTLIKQVTKAGVVSARLIAQDNFGCRDTLFQDSLLVVKDNNLSFWAPDKTLCLGDTVYFENFSAIKEPHYQWVFGDGDTTYGYNSKHLFTQAGTYNITLSYVNDTLCKQVLELKNYITVQDKPVADFTADTLISPCYPLPVTFQDLSTNPDIVSWQWDFGDGAKSTFQHPFHNYIKPGKYDVQLIVKTSNGCSDTIIKPQYIQTTGPTAEFSVSPDTACMNELFHFNISKMTNTGGWGYLSQLNSQRPCWSMYRKTQRHYLCN